MSKTANAQRFLRLIVLGLLILAIAGPWAYDRVMVPAEYACDIRLEGDFCGTPLSGAWILQALALAFFGWVIELVNGNVVLSQVGRTALYFLGVLALLLPLLSTLILILRGDHRRLRWVHLAVWAAAAGRIWALLLFSPELPQVQLWGLWIYSMLAPGVLILEAAGLVLKRTAGRVG